MYQGKCNQNLVNLVQIINFPDYLRYKRAKHSKFDIPRELDGSKVSLSFHYTINQIDELQFM